MDRVSALDFGLGANVIMDTMKVATWRNYANDRAPYENGFRDLSFGQDRQLKRAHEAPDTYGTPVRVASHE